MGRRGIVLLKGTLPNREKSPLPAGLKKEEDPFSN